MSTPENSLATWQTLANEAPANVLQRSNDFCDRLTDESRRALIASRTDEATLLQHIETGVATENAPLAGVPYILQDLFDVAGLPTHCGALFDDLFDGPLDESSALSNKLTELGAALLGKAVPTQFGLSLQGQNRSFGDCPHPEDPRLIAGGGAGACAHLVKAGWAPIAFGLDTAAGIRIPAAYQGLFGFRMGHNTYARNGVLPIAPSLDSVGWLCARADDLLRTIKAFYPNMEAAADASPRGYRLDNPRIRIDPTLKAGFMELVRHLDIDERPSLNKRLVSTFDEAKTALTTLESRELAMIHQYWVEEYREHYDEALLDRIEDGQICTAAKAERASAVQYDVRLAFTRFFERHDYLILPVTPTPTLDKGDWTHQMEEDLSRLNAPASLSALPALILPFPCGRSRYGAAQLILNPRKIHLCEAILEQVSRFYAR